MSTMFCLQESVLQIQILMKYNPEYPEMLWYHSDTRAFFYSARLILFPCASVPCAVNLSTVYHALVVL